MSKHKRFASVAVPLPLDKTFIYSIPDQWLGKVEPGMRVIVPFGHRALTGYVVALHSKTDVGRVKPIAVLPDEYCVFTRDMLELTKWLSEYYMCGWGEALASAAPPGLASAGRKRYFLKTSGQAMLGEFAFTDDEQAVVAALRARGPLTERQITRSCTLEKMGETLAGLEKRGVVDSEIVAPTAHVRPRTVTVATLRDHTRHHLAAAVENLHEARAPRQAEVLEFLAEQAGPVPISKIVKRTGGSHGAVRALEDKDLIDLDEVEVLRDPFGDLALGMWGIPDPFTLNEEQQAAYDAIAPVVDAGEYTTFLLKGVTSSGKTEVYLQIIDRALKAGRDAIMLVPEIALTPQTVARFRSRFGDQVALFHSALPPGERYDQWRRVHRGDARIVIGPRSAVFAPLKNLGVIVVDEEHEPTYKQNDVPRYHARDVAIMRASRSGAVVILGSATPSLESLHNTKIGKFSLLEIKTRISDRPLPRVIVVDMREEAKEAGTRVVISFTLQEKMTERIHRGEQSIIFLNRRGHAPFVLCRECGAVPQCRECQVSMTYHISTDMMHCHYCNARRHAPDICGECGSKQLLFLGAGTQRAEQNLSTLFPEARVERMDLDTTTGKWAHHHILQRYERGEIDILVGTQMVAKGLDFPGVTLVGVINADVSLSIPDFRAGERTFQLLTQVAGRAGRGSEPGEVVVQTYSKDHFSIRAAQHHDYDAYAERELDYRRQAEYPPFTHMVMITLEGKDEGLTAKTAGEIGRAVRTELASTRSTTVEVLGPAPAPIPKLRGLYRWHLTLLSKHTKRLHRTVRAAVAGHSSDSKVRIRVDVDPQAVT
jgi:primosomal protein N' (replication factor Y)